jgi:hypothetical protein
MAQPQTTGTLYVHLVGDPNPGQVEVIVRKQGGEILDQTTLTTGKVYDKQFVNIPLGPQEWYDVEIQWESDRAAYHNFGSDGINTIATGFPATSNNTARSWQVTGLGARGRFPVLMNLPQAAS